MFLVYFVQSRSMAYSENIVGLYFDLKHGCGLAVAFLRSYIAVDLLYGAADGSVNGLY